MAYHIGCEVKEQRGEGDYWLYVFVCPEDFPYDPVPGIEIAEKWALQDTHRNQLPKSPFFCGSPESAEDMRSWALGLREQFPPPPPPPPLPPPPEATPAQAQAGESLPEVASDHARTSTSEDAPSRPGRSRLPIVVGLLAAVGAVAILAAAWVLQQKGFLGHKVVVFPNAPESKAVPTVKADTRVSPEPKPSTPAPKTVLAPPIPSPQPPPTPVTPPTPPAPAPAIAEKSTPPPTPPPSPSPAPSQPRITEVSLVRRAAVAMNPASRMSAAEIGKLYVEQPVLNGKAFKRADIVRQVEQFRSSWDTQTYEIIEEPTVTSGAGSDHVTVKVKTRFTGVRKTGIKFATVTTTSEFVVIVGADGTPLIESQRELSQE
jgi:hypothetical protein